jgi:hypothetical protein
MGSDMWAKEFQLDEDGQGARMTASMVLVFEWKKDRKTGRRKSVSDRAIEREKKKGKSIPCIYAKTKIASAWEEKNRLAALLRGEYEKKEKNSDSDQEESERREFGILRSWAWAFARIELCSSRHFFGPYYSETNYYT